jgi:hypothetical protein
MKLGDEPAQVLDCTAEEYHAMKDAVSHSDCELLLKDPALYEWYVLKGNKRPKSTALEFGAHFDSLVLWPGPCCSRMALIPPECLNKRGALNTRGKAYKEWLPANFDKVIVRPGDPVHHMANNLMRHERARSLLDEPGQYQLKIRWQCRETSIWRRSMLDKYLPEKRLIVDLKTTRDISPKSFAGDCYRYGYASQLAYYQDAIAALNDDGELVPCVLIVCSKEPPYSVAVYDLSEEFLDLGRRRNEEALRRYLHCSLDDRWVGPGAGEIITLQSPNWAAYDWQWEIQGA